MLRIVVCLSLALFVATSTNAAAVGGHEAASTGVSEQDELLVVVPRLSDTRIVGGREVDIVLHPHQISMRYKSITCPSCSYSHRCGGSIYSANIVVTAAHCIIGTVASQFQVVAGSNQRRGSDGAIVPVKEIIMHEQYNPNTYDNDIALLILGTPLPLNNFTISTIELGDEDPRNGATATITGWGTTTEQGVASDTLQEVKAPVVSNDQCDEDYGGLITDSMLCAGLRNVGGKDACQGDSGGPLLVNGKLAGVVSWGYGCARPEYPGVYAKVSYLLPWLREKIALHE